MPQPASTPPAPVPPSLVNALRGLFVLRASPRARWPFALRAAACMGVPVLVGWLAGDVPAGLMATIGAFTGLYGSGRPYLSRAIELGVIALAFAVAVGLGISVAPLAWAVVPTIALIAMLATWLCNALQVGPPGAYMFLLACAAGTAMPAAHISAVHAAVLVLAGGAFAWVLHMAGALLWPRGPEQSAVATAGKAVAAFIEALGTPREDAARHAAALAMRDSWAALVSYQPADARPDSRLSRLRALNRDLHLLFAEAMRAGGAHAVLPEPALPASALATARRLIAQVRDPPSAGSANQGDDIPLGHPGRWVALLEAVRPGSPSLLVVLRVGVAALVAGALGATLGLERAYWAIAAAVLMLYQGFDWIRTVQRSLERLLGTWVGLLLAGAILAAYPQGLWLVAVIMALQFIIEMVVVRNYTLAVVFITGAALTIASGGHRVDALGELLLARGVDTAVGCAVALLVIALMAPRAAAARIPEQLGRSLDAVRDVVAHLAAGTVTTVPARAARRDLQHCTFALAQAYDAAVVASRAQRMAAEPWWPAIAATQRLAYRTLSTCWALERIGGEAAVVAARSMFDDGDGDGGARLQQALRHLARAVRAGESPEVLGPLPAVLRSELLNLHECLRLEGTLLDGALIEDAPIDSDTPGKSRPD